MSPVTLMAVLLISKSLSIPNMSATPSIGTVQLDLKLILML